MEQLRGVAQAQKTGRVLMEMQVRGIFGAIDAALNERLN